MPFSEGEEEAFLPPGDIDAPDAGSGPWSNAPVPETPVGTDATGGAEEKEPREQPPEFDPRFRQDWEGLTYVGYLTKKLTFLGHRFTIKTIDVDTILQIGMMHAPYVGTIADLKAYQALLMAGSIVTVDGKPLAIPLGEDDTSLEARFNVILRWFPATLDHLYTEYMGLETRVDEIIDAMQNGHLVGGARSTADSTPGLSPASV